MMMIQVFDSGGLSKILFFNDNGFREIGILSSNKRCSLGGENKALPLSFHYATSWNGADEEWAACTLCTKLLDFECS